MEHIVTKLTRILLVQLLEIERYIVVAVSIIVNVKVEFLEKEGVIGLILVALEKDSDWPCLHV